MYFIALLISEEMKAAQRQTATSVIQFLLRAMLPLRQTFKEEALPKANTKANMFIGYVY